MATFKVDPPERSDGVTYYCGLDRAFADMNRRYGYQACWKHEGGRSGKFCRMPKDHPGEHRYA